MGVVYRATDRVLNRRVAIKVMSDAIAKDADLRARFLREAQAAGSLQHPNVVTIYDFGEVDDHLYIAMEYVEGEDLEDLLVRRVRLPLDGKLAIMIDVLQGLAFAHKRGIVHRDIKPANVRVDLEGRARLMDFGIAHLDSAKMTRTGTMMGTPSYMAPEQIVGGIVTPATDIFSVGAVLYELLAGTRPFRGDSLQALMYQVLSQDPAPLQKMDPGLPAPLNDVVMRALQKQPGDRYQGALDMASDLANVRATLGSEGGRSSLSLRATIDSALALRSSGMRARARRRRNYFVGGALATVALMALVMQLPRQATGVAEVVSPGFVGTDAAIAVADTAAPPGLRAERVPDETDSAAPATVTPAPVDRPAPSAADIARVRRLQTTALTSRARAAAAGASEAQLRAGDAHNELAETRLAQDRVADARTQFSRAAASWTAAERLALQAERDRAEEASVAAVERVPPTTASLSPTSVSPASTPVVQEPVVQELPAPVVPAPSLAPDHSADIAAVIATYASALESRDIARLQRAYPGLTTEQRRAFSEFFRATRSLDVRLAVSRLQVDGASAQAQLVGTYEFVTSSGSAERRPASFEAVLRREQGAWRLMSVR
jgi:serine/threonine-protein kinase